MGLEDFNVSDTRSGSRTTTGKEEKSTTKDDAFKVVGSGPNQKVFSTEEEWDETAEYIENELRMNPQEVLNMSADKRHEILHRAILGKNGMRSPSFHIKRNCIVCGETFVFPNNWDFAEYKEEPACKHHTIKEVAKAHRQINEAAENMAIEQ